VGERVQKCEEGLDGGYLSSGRRVPSYATVPSVFPTDSKIRRCTRNARRASAVGRGSRKKEFQLIDVRGLGGNWDGRNRADSAGNPREWRQMLREYRGLAYGPADAAATHCLVLQ